MTLNLSKSVKEALLAVLAIFFAHELPFHLSCNLKSLIALESAALFTPLATSNLKSVKESLLIEISCLLTPELGPSIKTFVIYRFTLVVLIISTITANFPAKGPKLIKTTLPTSTNLLNTYG